MKKLLFFVAIISLFASCTIYMPEAIYTPTFRNKGEKQAEFYGGFAGAGVNLGYAPTEHLATTLGFSSQVSNDTTDKSNRNQVNLALGYYEVHHKNVTLEYFGGFAHGKYIHITPKLNQNISFNSLYFQPDFGITGKYGELAFTPRVAYFSLNELNSASKSQLLLFQPTLNFGFGYKKVYFFVNQSLQLPLNKAPDWFTPLPYSINIGIRIKLSRIFE